MYYRLRESMADRLNFDSMCSQCGRDAATALGGEAAQYDDGKITELAKKYFDIIDNIEDIVDDVEEAEARWMDAWPEGFKSVAWEDEAPCPPEIYLYLNETAHGKRFYRVHMDAEVGILTHPDRTILVLGPAFVGAEGYANGEDAVIALADAAGIDLEDVSSWPDYSDSP